MNINKDKCKHTNKQTSNIMSGLDNKVYNKFKECANFVKSRT